MEPFALRVPAQPASLALVRSELEAWLEREGISGQHAFDAVAAASEATSNAIEHAQQSTEPYVELEVSRGGSVLTIRVHDHGQWRPPRLETDRNHGLLLINGLMTRVEILRAEEGTTVTMELELVSV